MSKYLILLKTKAALIQENKITYLNAFLKVNYKSKIRAINPIIDKIPSPRAGCSNYVNKKNQW